MFHPFLNKVFLFILWNVNVGLQPKNNKINTVVIITVKKFTTIVTVTIVVTFLAFSYVYDSNNFF